jgi:hypothetical protein
VLYPAGDAYAGLVGPFCGQIGSHVTVCLPRSPKAKISPESVLAKRQVNEDLHRFLG